MTENVMFLPVMILSDGGSYVSAWDPGKTMRRLIGRFRIITEGDKGVSLGAWRRKPALGTPTEASVTPKKSPGLPFPWR